VLADRAAERLALHVARARLSKPVPSAFVRTTAQPSAPEEEAPSPLNGSHGLIGHNSAGIDIDAEAPASPPVPVAMPAATIAELAARAAAIQAAHVAESQRRLATFTVPSERAAVLLVEDMPRAPKAPKSPRKSARKRKKIKEN
jgi:branched-chain amino acid transport system ATP-binding protein